MINITVPDHIDTREMYEWCQQNFAPNDWCAIDPDRYDSDQMFQFKNDADAVYFKMHWSDELCSQEPVYIGLDLNPFQVYLMKGAKIMLPTNIEL